MADKQYDPFGYIGLGVLAVVCIMTGNPIAMVFGLFLIYVHRKAYK